MSCREPGRLHALCSAASPSLPVVCAQLADEPTFGDVGALNASAVGATVSDVVASNAAVSSAAVSDASVSGAAIMGAAVSDTAILGAATSAAVLLGAALSCAAVS